ncbi:dTDP-4-dehydrorhamnose 3,5-epimerase [Microbulbifer flavimaris]|uniref:dTDP-4-dehydrorhamnose 3,5-epimerase n=1 Tax=Microbulbifer flavimaris TaxID=1781068 RepID=A0ABX4HXF7_9GAMM|nr:MULTISPECIES: dTDP-4-dehydrorhamnose 3,5-epimerase [Microbulbifer]KUJ81452.1 dTDP-4-dehydrorhamnose 3,5-epimerase [Microbulbifer sp. ZGT114]PCO04596.1 dTDP-4-dehydrorhamnose 3,5-epimerase [Microbulbifer flavimaris]
MEIIETSLAGVKIVEPQVFADERGFFLETWQLTRYKRALAFSAGLEFVQDNHSRSARGVLRGMHFQQRCPQGKLVRAARGEIYDVVVDIDPVSVTFGEWIGVHLSEKNHRQLWIPPGYAHGFQVLSDSADVEYKCTDYYVPTDQCGVAWNDPQLAITWPLEDPLVSEQDGQWPTLEQLQNHNRERVTP